MGDEGDEITRLNAVAELVDGLRTTYSDAKTLIVEIRFEWQECNDFTAELCPIVSLKIER